MTSFIVRTLKTGRLGSIVCISRRICGSRLVADKEVRTATLKTLILGIW